MIIDILLAAAIMYLWLQQRQSKKAVKPEPDAIDRAQQAVANHVQEFHTK